MANKGETSVVALEEATSSNPVTPLGLKASILRSPSVAEKIPGGVISPSINEKMEKLTLD